MNGLLATRLQVQTHLAQKLPLWVPIALTILLLPSFIQSPAMPDSGLDPSWLLACEYAFQHHLNYGTQFIFTYGPFAFLTTNLYQAGTFTFVLLGDIFLGLLFFIPLILARELWLLVLYVISVVGVIPFIDATVPSSTLALFGLSLKYRNVATVAAAAVLSCFALSKYSFALLTLPLLLLSDAYHFTNRRRAPLFTLSFLVCFFICLEVVGRFTINLPSFIVNTADVITYYSRAMQFEGRVWQTFLFIGIACVMTAFVYRVVYSSDRTATLYNKDGLRLVIGIAVVWYFYVTFKMGYVRQDDHIAKSWHAAVSGFVVLLAIVRFLDLANMEGTNRPMVAIVILLAAVTCSAGLIDMRYAVGYPRLNLVPGYFSTRLHSLADSTRESLGWLSRSQWSSMNAARLAADRRLARSFPQPVVGTVDAIPWNVAPIIGSGLQYDPRPGVQSYSSYSPRLQRLERAFFNSPKAPDTLFLDLTSIDGRLPTTDVGPSLPVIGRWYDAVGLDPLGLTLRRRATPRPAAVADLGRARVKLGEWIPLPDYREGVLLATFQWPRSLFGRALSFAFREPILTVTLRDSSGNEYPYRYVPSMTEAGVVLAPLAIGDSKSAALYLLDAGIRPRFVHHIAAFRISGDRLAQWTYPGGRVSFQAVELAAGFSQVRLDLTTSLLDQLISTASTDQVTKGAVWLRGCDLFEHPPATLSANVTGPLVLRGSIGFSDTPQVRDHSEGVRFVISFAAINSTISELLLDQELIPKNGPEYGGPISFTVKIPGPGTLYLKTEPLGRLDYDWSIWRDIKVTR